MPETELNSHQNVAEKVKEQYDELLSIARFMITEDAQEYGIEAEDVQRIINPDENYLQWANRAVTGSKDLALPLAQVASALGEANRIGLAPMLFDPDWQPGEKVRDIGTIERFHFLRLFLRDCRQYMDDPFRSSINMHPIFFDEAVRAEFLVN